MGEFLPKFSTLTSPSHIRQVSISYSPFSGQFSTVISVAVFSHSCVLVAIAISVV